MKLEYVIVVETAWNLSRDVQLYLKAEEKITSDGPWGYRWELFGTPFQTGDRNNKGDMLLGQVLVRG
jgi:hypothetical protein